MKTSKYSASLSMSILKQAEAGTPVPNLCCEHGVILPKKMNLKVGNRVTLS